MSHSRDGCKLSEIGVITSSRTRTFEMDASMEHKGEPRPQLHGSTSPGPSIVKPLVDALVLEKEHVPRKSASNCDRSNVETPTSDPSCADSNKNVNIFRERNNNSDDISWLRRSLCNLPTVAALEESKDYKIAELDARSDTDTCGEWDVERRSPSPEKSYNFHVEVDLNNSTQIEVLTTSYCDDGNWSQTYFSEREFFPDENGQTLSPSQNKEEDNVINKLIEKNRFMCSGLESWYSTDESEQEVIVSVEPEMPRNRACHPEGRKKRIEHLKINLTPFELDEAAIVKGSVNSKKYDPLKFDKRHQSFSAFKTPSPTSVAASRSPTSRFECYELPACGHSNKNNSALVDWDEIEEEDLYYDSDPNELLLSRAMMAQAKKERKQKQNDRNEKEIQTVSQLMGSKMLLVWHRPFESSPVAVNSWIEHGSYISAGLIQPKLMWQESCGKERKDSERFILNTMSFHSIDLLDISKVIPLNRVDRDLYPFAKPSNSFLIQAYDKVMVFEAESTAERDKFIEGLKILVARLGSKIIVGDKDVLEEFFTPASSAVPGRAPDILTADGNVQVSS